MRSEKLFAKFIPPFALLAIVSLFVRYMQRKHELLANGSLVEGAKLHTVLLILSVCFCIGSAILLWKLERHTSWTNFRTSQLLPMFLFGAAGALFIGNLLLLISGQAPASIYVASAPGFSEFLNKLLPPLGLAASVCLGFFAYRCYLNQKPSALLYMCISLYLVVRLIVRFQAWNTDPSIHDYCYALLANISAMLATFHMAGFSFEKGKRRMSLFWMMCTALFCSITLADALYDGDLGELLIHLALLATVSVNIIQLFLAEKSE